MMMLVLGLVFGVARIVMRILLPISSAVVFGILCSYRDKGEIAELLSGLAVLAFALLGIWFMIGGPLKRGRNKT